MRPGRLDVTHDRLALAQGAMLGADVRHLPERGAGKHGLVLATGLVELLDERRALLEQCHLDLVVVVRKRKAAQGQHGVVSFTSPSWNVAAVYALHARSHKFPGDNRACPRFWTSSA